METKLCEPMQQYNAPCGGGCTLANPKMGEETTSYAFCECRTALEVFVPFGVWANVLR